MYQPASRDVSKTWSKYFYLSGHGFKLLYAPAKRAGARQDCLQRRERWSTGDIERGSTTHIGRQNQLGKFRQERSYPIGALILGRGQDERS